MAMLLAAFGVLRGFTFLALTMLLLPAQLARIDGPLPEAGALSDADTLSEADRQAFDAELEAHGQGCEGIALLQRAAHASWSRGAASAAQIPKPTEWERTEEEYTGISELAEPCVVIFATMAVSMLLLTWGAQLSRKKNPIALAGVPEATVSSTEVVPSSGRELEELRAPSRAQRTPSQNAALSWLLALILSTVCVLLGQIGLGLAANSLTLLADSPHTAADAITYCFSYLAERVKCGASASSRRAVARIDAFSAGFSVVVVFGASAWACLESMRRLQHAAVVDVGGVPGAELHTESEAEMVMLGPVLLGFSLISAAVNCGLLLLHHLRRRVTSAAPHKDSPSIAGVVPVVLPVPPAEISVPDVQAPPPPPMWPSPPPPPTAAVHARFSRQARTRRRQQIDWLHKAFHPSCDLAGCSAGCAPVTAAVSQADLPVEDSNPGLSTRAVAPEVLSSSAAASVKGKPSPGAVEDNLNLYGAMLHVATDVLRSVIIFVAGLLLQCGYITDSHRADAVCSLLVCMCVAGGSLPLVRGMLVALRQTGCSSQIPNLTQ